MKLLKKDADFIFTIRDIYLNSDTDNGMNYHGAMEEREKAGFMKRVN